MMSRKHTRRLFRTLLCGGVVSLANPASAGDWTLTNSINLNTYLSDNIRQTQGGGSGVGILISPRIGLTGKGRRVQGNLAYAPAWQSEFGSDASGDRFSQNLLADFNAELARRTLFVDALARAALITDGAVAGPIGADRTLASGTRQTYSYSLSPYTRHHLGAYADLIVRAGVNGVRVEGGQNTLDSDGRSVSAALSSGRGFTRLPWSLSLSRSQTSYSSRTDTRDRLSSSLGYRLDRKWRVDGTFGYDRFELASARSSTSGLTYSGVVAWTPNPRTSARIEMGQRYFGTFWAAHAEHRTRRTALLLDLSREITNVNTLLTQSLTNLEAFSSGLPGAITSSDPFADSNALAIGVRSEDYLNTRASLGMRVTGRRTGISATVDWSTRQYEVSGAEDRVLNLSLLADRRLGGGIGVGAQARWSDVASSGSADSQYLRLSLTASRTFGRYGRIGLDLSRQQQVIDGSNGGFTEHRIGISLSTRMF